MTTCGTHPLASLNNAGLNLVAIFPLSALPKKSLENLAAAGYTLADFRQLILVAHGGKSMWQALSQQNLTNENPVDTFSISTVDSVFRQALQDRRYQILYPGPLAFDLQALGILAGWHHTSPFWVGVNARYGSWFAYRALVLADSNFPLTTPWSDPSPCATCTNTPCVNACPAQAMQDGRFHLASCLDYRRQPESACRYQCLARNACPIGREHHYDAPQMKHHYAASLKFIEALP